MNKITQQSICSWEKRLSQGLLLLHHLSHQVKFSTQVDVAWY